MSNKKQQEQQQWQFVIQTDEKNFKKTLKPHATELKQVSKQSQAMQGHFWIDKPQQSMDLPSKSKASNIPLSLPTSEHTMSNATQQSTNTSVNRPMVRTELKIADLLNTEAKPHTSDDDEE